MRGQSLRKSLAFTLRAVPHCINSYVFTDIVIVCTAHIAFIALEISDLHSLSSEYLGRRAPARQTENKLS